MGYLLQKHNPDLNLATSRYTARRSSVVNPETCTRELTVRPDRLRRAANSIHCRGSGYQLTQTLVLSPAERPRPLFLVRLMRDRLPLILTHSSVLVVKLQGFLTTASPNGNCILLVRCFHQHLPVRTEPLAHAPFCPTSLST